MRIGIDATNIGGGGGITHLKEILNNLDNFFLEKFDVSNIVVYSSNKVLKELPNHKIIIKKSFPLLNGNILNRFLFQLCFFDKYLNKDCDVLISLTGDYIGSFRPFIGMSRNMLLYERDIWKEIKNKKEVLRFLLLFHKQKKCFNNANGIIFISNYAEKKIVKSLKLDKKNIIKINHGISPKFKNNIKEQKELSLYNDQTPYKLLYVSTVHVYKHQWNVVKAIHILREQGIPIELDLVGGVIYESAGERLLRTINEIDPKGEFIHNHGHIPYNKIQTLYKETDGIIFASTCENMPNILIEAMASGRPIACSKKDPMPEFLEDDGFYFESHNVDSIVEALKKMLYNPQKSKLFIENNLLKIEKYSWKKTSNSTFNFIIDVFEKFNK